MDFLYNHTHQLTGCMYVYISSSHRSGAYVPKYLDCPLNDSDCDMVKGGSGGRVKRERLQCDYYRLKPTLKNDLNRAQLVIGHGGEWCSNVCSPSHCSFLYGTFIHNGSINARTSLPIPPIHI
jgi:hypothetical protein